MGRGGGPLVALVVAVVSDLNVVHAVVMVVANVVVARCCESLRSLFSLNASHDETRQCWFY